MWQAFSKAIFHGNNPPEHFHFQHQMGKNVVMIISSMWAAYCVSVEPALKDLKAWRKTQVGVTRHLATRSAVSQH